MSPFYSITSSPSSTAKTPTCSLAPSFGSILRLPLLKWEIDLHNSEWVFLHYAEPPISTPENPAFCCTASSSASLSGLLPIPSQFKKSSVLNCQQSGTTYSSPDLNTTIYGTRNKVSPRLTTRSKDILTLLIHYCTGYSLELASSMQTWI